MIYSENECFEINIPLLSLIDWHGHEQPGEIFSKQSDGIEAFITKPGCLETTQLTDANPEISARAHYPSRPKGVALRKFDERRSSPMTNGINRID